MVDQAETIVWECIETRITSDSIDKNAAEKYLSNLKEKLDKAKEILLSSCRIGETFFTYMDFIGGKRFSNHPKNLDHVHKYSKDFCLL